MGMAVYDPDYYDDESSGDAYADEQGILGFEIAYGSNHKVATKKSLKQYANKENKYSDMAYEKRKNKYNKHSRYQDWE